MLTQFQGEMVWVLLAKLSDEKLSFVYGNKNIQINPLLY